LADSMEKLATDLHLRRQMSNHSREQIQKYSPAVWAQGIIDAVDTVHTRKA
jgi:hypothetical protein